MNSATYRQDSGDGARRAVHGTCLPSGSAFRCYYWFEDICPLNDHMAHEDIFAQTEDEAAYRFELRHGNKPDSVKHMPNAQNEAREDRAGSKL